MVVRTALRWSAALGLLASLGAGCGDDDDGGCKGARASCANGFDRYDEKTCTCERTSDAGTDAATTADAAAVASCVMPLATVSAPRGVIACDVERAYVECDTCGCLSEDPTTCAGCGAHTCTNQCQVDEYAIACGGLPRRDGTSYAQAPTTCRGVAALPSGTEVFCCPCAPAGAARSLTP